MTTTIHGTTILCVRKNDEVVLIADGQMTMGSVVMKATANKIRTMAGDKIAAGFAGSTADALALFEKLEDKVEQYSGQLARACVELAKDWRQDKYLRRLEAMMIVTSDEATFMLTGTGDVIEPEDNLASVGSGSAYALAAARALYDVDGFTAEQIARKSMQIAADMCVYSNHNFTIKKFTK